jgi:hypothetical protein
LIVSIHQPAYLPWLGYFEKIASSEAHVFLDNVQLEKPSFCQRNRIKTPQGPQWLSIPLHAHDHLNTHLKTTLIAEKHDWRRKHLKSIAQNYSKAPFFAQRFPILENWYEQSQEISNLADLCFSQLRFWLDLFGIGTRIVKGSEMSATGYNSDLVLAICKELNASTYISGFHGRDYLQEADFNTAGIRITYQSYAHPVYPQQHGEFLPAMSIVDYWFNNPDTQLFIGAS